MRAKLQADEQGARDSYWLATIDRNVPLELDVAHLPEQKIDREALYSLLTRLEFDQFIRKLGLTEGEEAAAPRLPALERCTIASAFEAFGLVDSLTEADRVLSLQGKHSVRSACFPATRRIFCMRTIWGRMERCAHASV